MATLHDYDEPEYAELVCSRVKAATPKAILVEIDGSDVWLPRSVVLDGETYEKFDEPESIEVAAWFAEKEGLI